MEVECKETFDERPKTLITFLENFALCSCFFRTSNDRHKVNVAKNVVRSLLEEMDDEVTRKKT